MTHWEREVKQSKEFTEKLKSFIQLRRLGEELYTGTTVDGIFIDYEDDVTELIESLSKDDRAGLQSYDAGFYMSLISFYRSIWLDNYDSKNSSNEYEFELPNTIEDEEFEEDNLNIIHE